ncbi:bifunctional phosphoglucose/phosphomannose isomerase [Kamptonema cortianum]|nr:bifunctional phosphoglucose/phosphomannose isomerase [Geitlerinema splendidum]MDK3162449.1 bifunctional phosphoglucose/phosphomannose isomerase [Kamptonema cortianum]
MLDDLEFLTRHDPSGMTRLTAAFPEQVRQAHEIASQSQITSPVQQVRNIVVTGLGGSAAGGDLLAALSLAEGKVPVYVNRDYSIPHWADGSTLVFACSYSGNTEETLAAYTDAKAKGCSLFVVTSGGMLLQQAGEDGVESVIVPGGQPPRTALGYMLVPLLVVCEKLGLIDSQNWEDVFASLNQISARTGPEKPQAENLAKQLAHEFVNKFPVLYGSGVIEYAVAQRWRGQLNENAKVLCLTHSYPELCHNEILGWEGSGSQGVTSFTGVLLSANPVSDQMAKRIAVTAELLAGRIKFQKVEGTGGTTLARILTLCHFADWLSLYIAALNGVDPGQMDAIDTLKRRLL